jgi:hypothetical protein
VPVWFAHDLHWTPNGHRIAAAAIDRYLEQIGVFDGDAGIGDLGDVGAWRRP